MGPTLQKRFKKIFLFTTLFVGLTFQGGYGQSQLSPGDIAIVTANADKNEDGDKIFNFVPLVDLEANTEIKFTDAPYIETNSELDDSEGTLTYTAPTAVPAGTVITYSGEVDGTNGFDKVGHFNPSTGGDNLIVFQGDRSNPNYLFGVGWAKGPSVWEYNAESSSSNRSDIPPGLSKENNSILSLGTSDNYQYDSDNGLEGTANSLLAVIGEESNWNNDDENAFPTFETDFTLVDPPTVAFTASSGSGEEGNTLEIKVELVEENDPAAVDVDLEFLASSSTVSSSDIDGFSSETLSFSASDASGTEKTVNITVADDSEFEGNEKAVFRLINQTEGTIIEPNEFTLTIADNDAPDIVINEFLADPGGEDVDGNGNNSGNDDEFVEFVNKGDADVDISGWEFSDNGSNIVKTFPEGTVIPAGRALVLFNNDADHGTPEGHYGGALVQISDNSLSLNNSGDDPTLFDASGNIVDQVSYSSSTSGVSLNRHSDGSEVEFASHTEFSENSYSPGTQADGTPFGAKHAISIRGTEGWRMISSPVQDASFNDFFGEFWMQGLTGSNDESGDATLFAWNESDGNFEVPGTGSMSDPIESGKGYIVYVFEDDEYNAPGTQGGFPKIVNTDKDENSGTITVDVSATDDGGNGSIDGDEGWNLLGNPFGTDISVTALLNVFEDTPGISVQGNEIQVWDHKTGNYIALEEGDRLAPFQAFFVKLADEANTSVQLAREDLAANAGTQFYKQMSNQEKFQVNLRLQDEQYQDTYSLEFSENGTTELDPDDSYKLFSLNPNSISMFSTVNNNYLRKNALPIDLKSNLEIPISFDANGRSELTFRWDDSMENIPTDWDLFLIDNDQNQKVDLRRNKEYRFTVTSDQQNESQSGFDRQGVLNKKNEVQDSRFVLAVEPSEQDEMTSDLPESVKLKPNYPNPFNPATTIPFELDEDSDVLLTVWNMIGQKVATLIDGNMEAGTHEATWNASDMPSGMYIARFEVNGTVYTRKMTLIK